MNKYNLIDTILLYKFHQKKKSQQAFLKAKKTFK